MTSHIIKCHHDITQTSFYHALRRLYDLNHLVFLYPNRLKDEVFGPYYSPQRMYTLNIHLSIYLSLLLLKGTDVRGDGYLDSVVKIFMPGSHTRYVGFSMYVCVIIILCMYGYIYLSMLFIQEHYE